MLPKTQQPDTLPQVYALPRPRSYVHRALAVRFLERPHLVSLKKATARGVWFVADALAEHIIALPFWSKTEAERERSAMPSNAHLTVIGPFQLTAPTPAPKKRKTKAKPGKKKAFPKADAPGTVGRVRIQKGAKA